ncbi:MAG: DUF899 family protein [Gammaproteobacteria bacterium]|jgi:predicted dithiol-disulfide oxidoreductase (DUF899 family)
MSDQAEIAELEMQIMELNGKLQALKRSYVGPEVPGYTFATLSGEVSLRDLFGDQDKLLVIHNMGQGCRYCTLWADGFNGLLPHLESAMSVVLVSRDDPELQRRFASSRGWRFRLASHGGGDYITEQTVMEGQSNMPGAVVYERDGEVIRRRNAAVFGPGDLYCAMWSLLGLAGLGEAEWTPQFSYWKRPDKLDDGGANVLD